MNPKTHTLLPLAALAGLALTASAGAGTVTANFYTSISPPSGPAQRLFQEPPAKSEFLAAKSSDHLKS